ncbi:hypothetical protein ACMBCN_02390 [Candidatus Liberibacter asiaticus]|nr:hypothetical protein [Candidatus Liberibacter asiaticus]
MNTKSANFVIINFKGCYFCFSPSTSLLLLLLLLYIYIYNYFNIIIIK